MVAASASLPGNRCRPLRTIRIDGCTWRSNESRLIPSEAAASSRVSATRGTAAVGVTRPSAACAAVSLLTDDALQLSNQDVGLLGGQRAARNGAPSSHGEASEGGHLICGRVLMRCRGYGLLLSIDVVEQYGGH